MTSPDRLGPLAPRRILPPRRRGRNRGIVIAAALAGMPGLAAAADHYITTQAGFDWLHTLDLEPGDRIFLRGGTTFSGTLTLASSDTGTDAAGQLIAPILITSYGGGRATISAGNGHGIAAYNNGGIEIRDLILTGSGVADTGQTTSTGSGITFYNDSPGDRKFHHLRIHRVVVSGFGSRGIAIGGYNGSAGYHDVEISGVEAHHNLYDGIETYAPPGVTSALTEVRIRHCLAHHHPCDRSSRSQKGNGIVLGGVTGGLIEHCRAHDNGTNNTASAGPVGIWAYDGARIVIQYCESHHNRTSGGDGGGFDLDLSVSDSVLQYNYSHDNDGAGFLIYGTAGTSGNDRNLIRYNISENDGRNPSSPAASGINISNNVDDLAVYGNTVILAAPPGSTTIPALKVTSSGSQPDDILIANNLFVTAGGTRLVNCDSNGDVSFAGNHYWSGGDPFVIRDDGQTYGSLAAWRTATGREQLAGHATGSSADPLFEVPPSATKALVPNPLAGLRAFKLQAGSPLINRGLDLKARFALDPGPRDFFGAALPQGSGLEIGAHEFAVTPPVILGGSHDPAGPTFRLRYQSEIGSTFTVRRSPDLATWTELPATASGTGAVMEYTDTPPPGGRHFYVLARE